MKANNFWALLSTFLSSLLLSPKLFACSVCFGAPGTESAKAVFASILLLATVVGLVLGGIALTGFIWAKRSKKLYGERY